MYARRLACRSQKGIRLCHSSKALYRLTHRDNASSQPCGHAAAGENCASQGNSIRRNLLDYFPTVVIGPGNSQTRLRRRPNLCWIGYQLRAYSSEGDGSNSSQDKHTPEKGGANFDSGKDKLRDGAWHFNEHMRLGEQDQKEWLHSEKQSMEHRRKESPFLSRREKFKNDLLRRVVPWEKLTVTWETFPYHIHEGTKNLLLECASSHLKHRKFATTYGARLASSSGRILLQSVPGTELYRERLVRALAQGLKVPLLVLDSSVLAPYEIGDEGLSESESDDNHTELGEECSSESEFEDDNDAAHDEGEWTSDDDAKSEGSDGVEADAHSSAEALRKLVPFNLDEFEERERASNEVESSSEPSKAETVEPSDKSKQLPKKGDRVKYIGPSVYIKSEDRSLSCGQPGEVYEVKGDRVGLIFDFTDRVENMENDKLTNQSTDPAVIWIKAKDLDFDPDTELEDCYIPVEALCEVLQSTQPLIVYFADSSQWLSRAVPKSDRKVFVHRVQEMFDQLSGPVVLICGQNKGDSGSKEKEKFSMILPNFGRLAKLPFALRQLTEGLKASKTSEDSDIYKLFTNVLWICPPKEEDLLKTFNKQVEEDRRIVISRSNITELHKVLEEHELTCVDLLLVSIDGVIFTKQKAEMVVGWARNHYLSSCIHPSIKGERLQIPRQSLETAILRLKEQESISKKPSQNLKNIAKNEYERNFISAVVPPGEIGVKFDDIGALEDIKRALNELVILPMKRPELFSHGNLLRPCKGILLFGPPGTGKTLLAKALATEAGANFISITGSTLTSKWFGDAEKLTKALFSFASKLAPVIIFVDEVDSLLGARGGAFEHEATRRMRNEFMAAWDGLRSKDSHRILILGATNRPFDLDDAVIRRLPRRVYVDLPDAKNRMKILKIFLAQENLQFDFEYEKLANATEGYSGSDLKNLCIAAAYRPVQELLENEKMGSISVGAPVLRLLTLEDFIQSKAKVGPSVAYDATTMNELRKWNEQYGEDGSRQKSPFGFDN